MKHKIPILYIYIYKHILHNANNSTVIMPNLIYYSMRRVMHKAPACVYSQICSEFEEYSLIKKVNKQCYKLLITSMKNDLFKNLKNHVFPI